MISIIVPVYNSEKYLTQCIESVLNQDFCDWELLIVDDGSVDQSRKIVETYISDKRIKYYHKRNSGVTETRWLGVEHSNGDILMFLDSDDVLLEHALSSVIDNFDKGIDILAFGIRNFKNNSDIEKINGDTVCQVQYENGIRVSRAILAGSFLSCLCGGAYRRDIIIDKKRIFCNGLRIGEDTMFNLELSVSRELKVKYITSAIYGYRDNQESVTRSVNSARFDSVIVAIEYLRNFEQRNPRMLTKLSHEIAFRKLLLWSTCMFHPDNKYYHDRKLRKNMRSLYPKAFSRLYPYLKVYLFLDLFIGSWLSQKLIKRGN